MPHQQIKDSWFTSQKNIVVLLYPILGDYLDKSLQFFKSGLSFLGLRESE